MNECLHADAVPRERGPENGYPDRRPAKGLNLLTAEQSNVNWVQNDQRSRDDESN